MGQHVPVCLLRFFARCLVWSIIVLAGLLRADIVWAETPCQAASEGPNFDARLTPLHIKLSGFVNTRPEASSLGFVKLEIRSYQVTAYFEVVTAEAVDIARKRHRESCCNRLRSEAIFLLWAQKICSSRLPQPRLGRR